MGCERIGNERIQQMMMWFYPFVTLVGFLRVLCLFHSLVLSLSLLFHTFQNNEAVLIEPVPAQLEEEADGNVGTKVVYEDNRFKIWNFTLEPGQSTSCHRHIHDYHFIVLQPSTLEVFACNGSRLFDFFAEKVMGFTIEDELLVPVNVKLPFAIPRTHIAKNIGTTSYSEILIESKLKDDDSKENSKKSKECQAA